MSPRWRDSLQMCVRSVRWIVYESDRKSAETRRVGSSESVCLLGLKGRQDIMVVVGLKWTRMTGCFHKAVGRRWRGAVTRQFRRQLTYTIHQRVMPLLCTAQLLNAT